MDAIDALRRELHRDPRRAAEQADALVAGALDREDDRLLARSLAVRGRARRKLGDVDLALDDLRAAAAAAERCGDPDLVGDAHVGMAGVLTFAGRSDEALDHLDRAERQGTPRAVTYAAVQRAAVHQVAGRSAEALAVMEDALPRLREVGEQVDVAMALMNRGLLHTDGGDLAAAVSDFEAAREIWSASGDGFQLAQTSHNLGWASLRGGDLPAAMSHLDAAIDGYTALGGSALDAEIDRAEVLLAAGLAREALDLASSLAARLDAGGDLTLGAYARLLAARAARLDGDGLAAAAFARRARALFAEQRSTGYELAARMELLRAGDDQVDETALVELAGELDRNGSAVESVRALAHAAELAAARGDGARATAHAAECAARADRFGLAELRLGSDHALAVAATAVGDRAAARHHLRRGHAEMERHRAMLGASDARAAVTAHGAGLLALGLRTALRTGSAVEVFEWMERSRSGRSNPPPARPPSDPELAADLMQLRTVAATMRQRSLDGAASGDLLVRQRELEHRVHRRLMRDGSQFPPANCGGDPGRTGGVVTTGVRSARPPSPGEVRSAVAGSTLVSLAEIEDRIVAVVVGPRRSRLTDLGEAKRMNAAAETVSASLRSLADPRVGKAGDEPHRSSQWARFDRAMAALDAALWPVAGADGDVVLVLPPKLHVVPWHLLPCLRGRAVTVAPSASWLVRTAGRHRPDASTPSVLAVAGPRLAEADREVIDVAATHPRAVVLRGRAATVDAVTTAVASATTVHLAVHGRFRHDNPLWSTLELFDGPLPVYELESVPTMPATVVLAACDSGLTAGRAGESLVGIAAAILGMGTTSLVASLCPLPDTPATRTGMVELHRLLASGSSPAAALATLAAGGRHAGLVSSVAVFGR